MDIKKTLKKIELFDKLSDLEIDEIAGSGKIKSYGKAETIFSQGQEAIGAFIVLSGKVKVYKLGVDGKEHILHFFGPGELFAESAMLAGKAYPAFAQALEESQLFYLLKSNFLFLLEKKPSLAMKMLASQAARLRNFAAKIEDLSLREVSARLAGYLVEQAEIAGVRTTKGLVVRLSMNKTQLAAYLGTVSETLSRTLAGFKSKGIVDEQNNCIIIKNLEKLRDLSMV